MKKNRKILIDTDRVLLVKLWVNPENYNEAELLNEKSKSSKALYLKIERDQFFATEIEPLKQKGSVEIHKDVMQTDGILAICFKTN